MAGIKNERNYRPKTGVPIAEQMNGTQSSAAAPYRLWKSSGGAGGRIYGLKCTLTDVVGGGGTRNFDIYFSADGATFKKILRVGLTGGAVADKKLFTDFWDTAFKLDADGNKYINVEDGGGFFADVIDNTNTIDFEAYGEDY